MQSHPYAQLSASSPRMRGEHTLCFSGALHRVEGAAEGDKERVALSIHFMTIPLSNRSPHNFVMLAERHRILSAQLFEQACRTFDVCEKKRDRSRWLYRCAWCP